MYYKKYIKYKNKYLNLKAGSNINTYYVKSSLVDMNDKPIIEELLDKRGNWVEYDKNKHDKLTFLYVDDVFIVSEPKLYSMKADIKNLINENKKSITDKDKLYMNLYKLDSEICEKYMAKQYQVTSENYRDIDKKIFDNDIWIIKGVRSFKGTYNKVVDSYQSYLDYFENVQSHPSYVKKHNYVIEKYFTNFLLIDKKKFHIRMLYLYYNKRGYLYKGDCILAEEEYKNEDWLNTKIHDTHGLPGDTKFIEFPNDITCVLGDKLEYVMDQLKELFSYITKLITPGCYPEVTKNICFECFGPDIAIMDDYSVKLLEINEKQGFGNTKCNPKIMDFYTNYLEGLLEVTIDKIIPPKNKIEINNYFIDVT